MKKYFAIAAAAALVLGACTKNDIPETTRHEIGFSTYAPKATRAGDSFVTGTNFSEVPAAKQVIGVFAWNTGATAWASYTATTPNFFKTAGGVAVTLAGDGATASSNYSPVRYWPTDETNNKLTFFAYYPSNTIASGITVNDGAAGLPTFGFTVADAAADQVDFMVAAPVADQVYSTNSGVVPFVFGHKLTQVNVYAKLKDDADNQEGGKYKGATITLKSLSISGLKNSGTYTFDADAPAALSTWSATSGSKTYAIFSGEGELTTTAQQLGPDALATSANKAYTLLLLPQELGDATYSISYDVTYTDGTVTSNSFTGKTLSNATVSEWNPNKSVKYTFEIGLNVIQFTATAGEWEEGGTEIISVE